MKKIPVHFLTEEAFAPFGSVIAVDVAKAGKIPAFPIGMGTLL